MTGFVTLTEYSEIHSVFMALEKALTNLLNVVVTQLVVIQVALNKAPSMNVFPLHGLQLFV